MGTPTWTGSSANPPAEPNGAPGHAVGAALLAVLLLGGVEGLFVDLLGVLGQVVLHVVRQLRDLLVGHPVLLTFAWPFCYPNGRQTIVAGRGGSGEVVPAGEVFHHLPVVPEDHLPPPRHLPHYRHGHPGGLDEAP